VPHLEMAWAYRGMDIQIQTSLTLALYWDERLASCSNRFTPGEGAPSANLSGGRVGRETAWIQVRREKFNPRLG
jgi:hypothetical protein